MKDYEVQLETLPRRKVKWQVRVNDGTLSSEFNFRCHECRWIIPKGWRYWRKGRSGMCLQCFSSILPS